LKFKDGMLISARLSFGNTGLDYVLRDPHGTKQSMRERLGVGGRKSYSFEIPPRDEGGSKALNDLMNRGVNSAANSLTQAADHLSNFFVMLRTELAFYVGCLNLNERLSLIGEPVCTPQARPWSPARLSFAGLYDVCLALRNNQRVVGNDANANDRTLVIVTGANSGGKSTFLRSAGMATLMMRSGMFVAAESFEASTCEGVFTHFVREEDATMNSGKLDEELARMSLIADEVTPHCLVLFNESFSATNEREGSEIARQVLQALIDSDVRAVVVTHLFELAEHFYLNAPETTLFLQAGRESEAGRTFKLLPGEPLPTSFAEDVYERIGGW
jgi:DNA mismatch repair ATPase MutS